MRDAHKKGRPAFSQLFLAQRHARGDSMPTVITAKVIPRHESNQHLSVSLGGIYRTVKSLGVGQLLTSRLVGIVRHAKLAAPIALRDLLQLRTQALGVENQRARVAAEKVTPVRANLAKIVVVLGSAANGREGARRGRKQSDRAVLLPTYVETTACITKISS